MAINTKSIILTQIRFRMKKTLQSLIFLLIFGGLQAQDYTLDPGVLEFNFGTLENTTQTGYILTNNTSSDLSWAWTVEKDEDFPAEWQLQVCDQLLCWSFDTEQMPADNGLNTLASGAATAPVLQYVKVKNNGVAGTGKLKLCIYDSHDFESEPLVCTSFSTSVAEEDIADINIYPNPASDYFQLTENSSIKTIQIYDIVGKNVATYQHQSSGTYDISNLRDGLYVVRLLDVNGKVAKSMRLSKR